MSRRYRDMEERLWMNSAEPEDGSQCRLWLGFTTSKGYGRVCIRVQGKTHPSSEWVHRVAYTTFIGPIPHGMEIDHKCGRESCIAPWHLEPVTGAENIKRRDQRAAAQAECKLTEAGGVRHTDT